MRTQLRSLGIAAFFVFATGCVIPKAHLEADRKIFEAVAPGYVAYVEADPKLDQEAKDRLKRTVAMWNLHISKAGDP